MRNSVDRRRHDRRHPGRRRLRGSSQETADKHVTYNDRPTEELKAELVEAHMGLATQVAKRFAHRGEPLDDLVQVALMALIKALDRYDPERGVKFSTYATSTMSGELKRYFRDHAWSMRIPRSLQELHLDTNEAVEVLRHRKGRSPTIPEIAEYVRTSEEDVAMAIEVGRVYRLSSLDAPVDREELAGRGAQLGEPDDGLDAVEDRELLSPLLDHLPERERRILDLRFGKGLTQSEIASEVGLSQMHVSRLLSRSLDQLRTLADRTASV